MVSSVYTKLQHLGHTRIHTIRLLLIVPAASRANGQVEWVVQSKNVLNVMENCGYQKWQNYLGKVQLALNSKKH